MEIRKLGRTDISIPALGLGTVTFGREIDEETSFRMMDCAMENGLTLFDTAEAYGGGNAREYRRQNMNVDDVRETTGEMHSSELIVGRWLRERNCRDQIVLCTKMSPPNPPDNIDRAVRDSIERLGVDCIDLYYLHSWDDDTPIDESLDALSRHVEAGRVRSIGCSNFTGEQLQAMLDSAAEHGYARPEAIQNNYNLACRDPEPDVFRICQENGVSFIAYSPIAAGFLTGKYTPDRDSLPAGSRFAVIPGHCDVFFTDRNFRIVEQLREKSEQTGQTMATLASAWVTSSPNVACTLFGARKIDHLLSGVAACESGIDAPLRAEMSAWE